MNLEQLKLSGFKSFVDPTVIKFQSNLTAILGPNGCGKSNVVDAIRCVIGESSSKNLRAESMSDVIFNGTTNRKPVGQASIELVFDNSDGQAGGEYAQYSTISIRRTLERDGQSSYFLNGGRCRRKDILDVFLGTGLGPRSYSIIEQGMISKLIEAKPDDLRVYLEEAAGISKYKERRRETENRIRHTRENLERLTDVRQELEKQLNHLKRQASAAERYKVLQAEVRLYKAQLYAMQLDAFTEQAEKLNLHILELETQVDAKIAEQRSIDAKVEELRENHYEQTQLYEEIQQQYYQVGTEITRLEQQISHAKERERQIHTELQDIQTNQVELEQQLSDDEEQLTDIATDIESLGQLAEDYKSQSQTQNQQLIAAESAMQSWREQWEEFQRDSANTTRAVEVQQTKLDHVEQKIHQLQQRIERVNELMLQLDDSHSLDEIEQKQDELRTAQAEQEQLTLNIEEIRHQLSEAREEHTQAQHECQMAQGELQQAEGRYSALEALQQAALGKNNSDSGDWLIEQGYADQPRLAEQIQVQSGWETAVETVLGSHLEAICVEGFEDLSKRLLDASGIHVNFVNATSANHYQSNGDELLTKITSDLPLAPILHGILFADTLQEAMDRLPHLQPHQSIITREGIWLSQTWLKLHAVNDATQGVLQRQQEMESLEADIKRLTSTVTIKLQQVSEIRQHVETLEDRREECQQLFQDQSRQVGEIKAVLRGFEAKREQMQQQKNRLQDEQEEHHLQMEECREQREQWMSELTTMRANASLHIQRQTELQQQKDTHQTVLDNAKSVANLSRQKAEEIQVRFQSSQSQRHYLEQSISRATQQLERLTHRRDDIMAELTKICEPIPENSELLEEKLAQHLDIEKELNEAKRVVGDIDATMRESEKRRHQLEQYLEDERRQLEQSRMTQQSVKIKSDTLLSNLCELGADQAEVLQSLPEEAELQHWQNHIQVCEEKIQRLGAINLAAIEECEELEKRKEYLDQQDLDLNDALNTLENAIKKIDKETRACFKDTFDTVNGYFQTFFPKIFGGGNATLELTGEDLLDTGVTVRAQPPGKKNSTIHALSGGEKALTAIALVFSFFQLNPAPFCILDEVDAPLDDANVVRFCETVKSMSDKVQFIFITHNKVTMEMAEQLIGVTMQEAGVSRTVTVDIKDALEIAEAA